MDGSNLDALEGLVRVARATAFRNNIQFVPRPRYQKAIELLDLPRTPGLMVSPPGLNRGLVYSEDTSRRQLVITEFMYRGPWSERYDVFSFGTGPFNYKSHQAIFLLKDEEVKRVVPMPESNRDQGHIEYPVITTLMKVLDLGRRMDRGEN